MVLVITPRVDMFPIQNILNQYKPKPDIAGMKPIQVYFSKILPIVSSIFNEKQPTIWKLDSFAFDKEGRQEVISSIQAYGLKEIYAATANLVICPQPEARIEPEMFFTVGGAPYKVTIHQKFSFYTTHGRSRALAINMQNAEGTQIVSLDEHGAGQYVHFSINVDSARFKNFRCLPHSRIENYDSMRSSGNGFVGVLLVKYSISEAGTLISQAALREINLETDFVPMLQK